MFCKVRCKFLWKCSVQSRNEPDIDRSDLFYAASASRHCGKVGPASNINSRHGRREISTKVLPVLKNINLQNVGVYYL